MIRIGPRMQELRSLVLSTPGKCMLFYASRIGPHGSRFYGYRTIHRALKAGVISRQPGPRAGTYTLLIQQLSG